MCNFSQVSGIGILLVAGPCRLGFRALDTSHIVRKSNARMELLRRVASFGTSLDDLRNIYILFVRSQLEQSAVVWHSSLTEQNRNDLERVQKSALKVILGEKYQSYNKALIELNLETLEERRNTLCLKFAQKCLTNEKNQQMFPLSNSFNGNKKT